MKKLPLKLSPREFEVLDLTSNAHTAQDVADILFISRRTVEFHLTNIRQKMTFTYTDGTEIRSKSAMLQYARSANVSIEVVHADATKETA